MPVTDTTFTFFQALIREKCAVELAASRRYLVEGRLLPVAREHGMKSVEELAAAMRGPQARLLVSKVVDALTTHETSFYRDAALFHVLGETVLPKLSEVRAKAGQRVLNIWSAACSSGQEPVTLAVAALENRSKLNGCSVKILATDISEGTLAKAKEATFSALEVGRGLPPALKSKYFAASGTGFQAKPNVRALIDFRVVNLARPLPPMPRFDVVLLRNVLIYFDLPTRRRILMGARRAMAPDAYLALGASETVIDLDDQLVREVIDGVSIYHIRAAKGGPVASRS